MSPDFLDPILRLMHIFGGVFWTGTSFFLPGFLGPSIQATAPEGAKVMQHLLARTRFLRTIILGSTLTLVTGLWMLFRDSGGFQIAWLITPTGLTLSLGAFFGTLAFFHGFLAIGRPNMKIAAIVRSVMASGGALTPEQGATLMTLQAKVAANGPILVGLQILALIGMSINEAF